MLKKDKKGMTLSMLAKLVIGAILLWVLLALIIGPEPLLKIAAKGAEWFADKALFGLIKTGQKPVLESDKSIEETYENILSILRTEGSGPCVFKYKPFSKRLSDFNIKLSNNEQGIYVELENKKNQQIIKSNTVAGKVACVVGEGQAARNFYNNYLDGTPCEDNCPKDYSVANIIITSETFDTKGTIYVNGRERDFNDRYLIFKTREEEKGKGGNVCFFPTISFNKLPGCDAGEQGLDDDCMDDIEKIKMKKCGEADYKDTFFRKTYYGKVNEWRLVDNIYYYAGNDPRVAFQYRHEAKDMKLGLGQKGLTEAGFNDIFSSGTNTPPSKSGVYYNEVYYDIKDKWRFKVGSMTEQYFTCAKCWIYVGDDDEVPREFKTQGIAMEEKVRIFGPPFEEGG